MTTRTTIPMDTDTHHTTSTERTDPMTLHSRLTTLITGVAGSTVAILLTVVLPHADVLAVIGYIRY